MVDCAVQILWLKCGGINMICVIYKKVDLRILGILNEYQSLDEELDLNIIPIHGGRIEDYDCLDVPRDALNFTLERGKDNTILIVDIKAPPVTSVPTYPGTTLEERVEVLELGSIDTMGAIAEVYEGTLLHQEETLSNMMATTEIFEYVMSLETQLADMKHEIQQLKKA